jgi:hypothetical protein
MEVEHNPPVNVRPNATTPTSQPALTGSAALSFTVTKIELTLFRVCRNDLLTAHYMRRQLDEKNGTTHWTDDFLLAGTG